MIEKEVYISFSWAGNIEETSRCLVNGNYAIKKLDALIFLPCNVHLLSLS